MKKYKITISAQERQHIYIGRQKEDHFLDESLDVKSCVDICFSDQHSPYDQQDLSRDGATSPKLSPAEGFSGWCARSRRLRVYNQYSPK